MAHLLVDTAPPTRCQQHDSPLLTRLCSSTPVKTPGVGVTNKPGRLSPCSFPYLSYSARLLLRCTGTLHRQSCLVAVERIGGTRSRSRVIGPPRPTRTSGRFPVASFVGVTCCPRTHPPGYLCCGVRQIANAQNARVRPSFQLPWNGRYSDMAANMNQFMTDEYVLAYHGPLLYEARILLAENWTESNTLLGTVGPHYFIHYKGWKQTWDEWVPEARLLKLNEAGFAKRRQLLEQQTKKTRPIAATTAAVGSPAGSSVKDVKGKGKKGETSKKRARDSMIDTETEYLKRPEVKIVIPDVLKLQLVDDWENVTKNNQLVTLPRKPNVRELLEEYRQYVLATKKSQDRPARATALLSEIISGITLYFDKALGNNLLYRFERAQYVEQKRANADKAMSEIYGAEHLLRLFVNFGPFIAYTNIDTESLNILREYINDIMKWMIKEQKRLFVKEYETTTTQYQSLSRT